MKRTLLIMVIMVAVISGVVVLNVNSPATSYAQSGEDDPNIQRQAKKF